MTWTLIRPKFKEESNNSHNNRLEIILQINKAFWVQTIYSVHDTMCSVVIHSNIMATSQSYRNVMRPHRTSVKVTKYHLLFLYLTLYSKLMNISLVWPVSLWKKGKWALEIPSSTQLAHKCLDGKPFPWQVPDAHANQTKLSCMGWGFLKQ